MQVEWEFWTNSNDECGVLCNKQRKFIKVSSRAAAAAAAALLARLCREAVVSNMQACVTGCVSPTKVSLPMHAHSIQLHVAIWHRSSCTRESHESHQLHSLLSAATPVCEV
jgi:hypothetical protein